MGKLNLKLPFSRLEEYVNLFYTGDLKKSEYGLEKVLGLRIGNELKLEEFAINRLENQTDFLPQDFSVQSLFDISNKNSNILERWGGKRCLLFGDSYEFYSPNLNETYKLELNSKDVFAIPSVFEESNQNFSALMFRHHSTFYETKGIEIEVPVLFSKSTAGDWLNQNLGLNQLLYLLEQRQVFSQELRIKSI